MINKRPVIPNTSDPMMASRLSHSRSSVKKLRLEGSTLGTDCYGIVSGNFSDGLKCVRGTSVCQKLDQVRNLHEL